MEYLLEHQEEVLRLERQSRQPNYSLKEELNSLKLLAHSTVLDAGCGSGLISRFLMDEYPGIKVKACDASPQRVSQARELSNHGKYAEIEFFQSQLEQIPLPSNSVDAVVCRFVYEYLPNPQIVTSEFHRILKPGGIAYLIDLDGIFLNYWTLNPTLNNYIEQLRQGLKIDLFVGRKLAAYLHNSSFKNIHTEASVHTFLSSQDLEEEYINNKYRLKFGRDVFEKILGGPQNFLDFQNLYLQEMTKATSCFFFNKFVCWGHK